MEYNVDWTTYPCDTCQEGIEDCKACISYGDCKHVNQCIMCKCATCDAWELENNIKNWKQTKE